LLLYYDSIGFSTYFYSSFIAWFVIYLGDALLSYFCYYGGCIDWALLCLGEVEPLFNLGLLIYYF